VRELLAENDAWQDTTLRPSKYLNNLIEQDHRGVKLRIGSMPGFKDFKQAAVTIAGIELLHRIHEGQFALSRLCVQGQSVPEIWNAVLAA
jgi:transposase-like protein